MPLTVSSAPSTKALWRPALADIAEAAERLRPHAARTPLLENAQLNERLGGRLLLKAEPLQRTGSFKFRGAYNRVSRLGAEERARGVVAYSSGNHAQGVACAAGLCSAPAVIVMPADAPKVKLANTRALGAEVVTYDRLADDREAIGDAIARERGLTLVRPYDDPWIIAGQGTVGLEIAEQCAELAVTPDAVLVPCGGGGLVAGTSTAIRARLPGAEVYAVEPAGFDDTARSLAAGRRLANSGAAKSICDALLAPMPGELTFAINRELLAGGLVVTDAEAERAMATAFHYFKLVVEPGGAVALAAALAGKLPVSGRAIVVVASGGNVDPAHFASVLGRAQPI
jgi:threonine dehydratase